MLMVLEEFGSPLVFCRWNISLRSISFSDSSHEVMAGNLSPTLGGQIQLFLIPFETASLLNWMMTLSSFTRTDNSLSFLLLRIQGLQGGMKSTDNPMPHFSNYFAPFRQKCS